MKKSIIGAALVLGLAAVPALAEYPEKEIQGIIQWGAGGSTDTVSRAVTPHAEKVLGGKVVLQNVTGGVGAIALNQVVAQDADGYTLLFGAENPLLYKVLGLGTKDYGDFTPINVLARGVPLLVANMDAPFDSYAEMVAYAQENPRTVKIGSTGPGGLPSVISAMMAAKTPMEMTVIPYDGDGPALTALMGGAIDVMPAVLGAAIENIKAGKMKPIALFDTEANAALPDLEPLTVSNPEFADVLPWGPFFGIFVKDGTPDDVVARIQAAYHEAAQTEDFNALLENRGYSLMNISGQEAEDFLSNWQRSTAWLIHDAGLTKVSPADAGIEKP
ncbi:MAG: tripartite tricarboxylate transporter substrate binding protein [Pseudorhodobacter sp.]